MLLAVVASPAAGLWIGSLGLNCFADIGPWWRGRVIDSFVEARAQVDDVRAQRKMVPGSRSSQHTAGQNIVMTGRYRANGTEYPIAAVVELLSGSIEIDYDDKAAAARAQEIRRMRPVMQVFYDPRNPAYAVLAKDSIPGFFQVAVVALVGGLIELMALIVLAAAPTVLYLYLQQRAPRCRPRGGRAQSSGRGRD